METDRDIERKVRGVVGKTDRFTVPAVTELTDQQRRKAAERLF